MLCGPVNGTYAPLFVVCLLSLSTCASWNLLVLFDAPLGNDLHEGLWLKKSAAAAVQGLLGFHVAKCSGVEVCSFTNKLPQLRSGRIPSLSSHAAAAALHGHQSLSSQRIPSRYEHAHIRSIEQYLVQAGLHGQRRRRGVMSARKVRLTGGLTSLRPDGVNSISVTSSNTMLTYSSKPRSVPTISFSDCSRVQGRGNETK